MRRIYDERDGNQGRTTSVRTPHQEDCTVLSMLKHRTTDRVDIGLARCPGPTLSYLHWSQLQMEAGLRGDHILPLHNDGVRFREEPFGREGIRLPGRLRDGVGEEGWQTVQHVVYDANDGPGGVHLT